MCENGCRSIAGAILIFDTFTCRESILIAPNTMFERARGRNA